MKKMELYKEKAVNYFKDHKASVVLRSDDFLVIDWKNRNGSSEYYIRYILDIQRGSLIIQGDLGDAIATWYNPVTPEDMYSYIKDIHYFASKLRCSTDKYSYYNEDIREDLEEWKRMMTEGYDPELDADKIRRLETLFKELEEELEDSAYDGPPYSEDATSIMNRIDPDYWEGISAHLGRRLAGRVYLWAFGYRMAFEQIKNTIRYKSECAGKNIRIELNPETILIAEISPNTDFKEICVGIEKDGCWHQDLVVVREAYKWEEEFNVPQYVPRPGEYEVLIYGNPEDEDYTGDPIEIKERIDDNEKGVKL